MGFTPEESYYIWLWPKTINEILANVVPTSLNTSYDNYDKLLKSDLDY